MVGERPLLWHVMRYYAHFGRRFHCLPLYGAAYVKDIYLNYNETKYVILSWRIAPESKAIQD